MFCFVTLTTSVTQNIRGAAERHCLSKGILFNQQDKHYNLYLKIIRLITLINVTKRYQLARKMTNICDLCEFQSFVVHEEHVDCYDTRLQKRFEAYPRIFVYVNPVTLAACVDDILMNLVFK